MMDNIRRRVMKKLLEKLKTLNLTIPILIVLLGIFITTIYVADQYGIINIAGEKEKTKEEIVDKEKRNEEEKDVVDKKESEPEPEPEKDESSIVFSLKGSAYDKGVKLYWDTSGVDTKYGYKIVKSKNWNPVYPGNDYKYISNSAQESYAWEMEDGKTYYFRVCQYLGGSKCGYYSNNLKLTAPYVAANPPTENNVKSINLSFVKFLTMSTYNMDLFKEISEPTLKQAKVQWVVDGYSKDGFKLVWSKAAGPTYPKRATDKPVYYSNPTTTLGVIDNFDGDGKYYVRVCEYVSGKCGVYSNQIEIAFDTSKI